MKILTVEEWKETKSYCEIVVPEIGAVFFTGGRPTTYHPDSGLSTISSLYTNYAQQYLSGMTQPGSIERVRHQLQGFYIQLVSDKTPKHPHCIDQDYQQSML